jgi:hypothetical protein
MKDFRTCIVVWLVAAATAWSQAPVPGPRTPAFPRTGAEFPGPFVVPQLAPIAPVTNFRAGSADAACAPSRVGDPRPDVCPRRELMAVPEPLLPQPPANPCSRSIKSALGPGAVQPAYQASGSSPAASGRELSRLGRRAQGDKRYGGPGKCAVQFLGHKRLV